ncbi:hypothetical protein C5167_044082 [Papaver somniferum]|uniref:Uncharacterized protein n=1 Tax=Papaver somniferum TaxID=3469 RepID=A0A4Y7LB37_PAPSO|nr:hypothetical protein C5167_044082 [Papaver somniferum]
MQITNGMNKLDDATMQLELVTNCIPMRISIYIKKEVHELQAEKSLENPKQDSALGKVVTRMEFRVEYVKIILYQLKKTSKANGQISEGYIAQLREQAGLDENYDALMILMQSQLIRRPYFVEGQNYINLLELKETVLETPVHSGMPTPIPDRAWNPYALLQQGKPAHNVSGEGAVLLHVQLKQQHRLQVYVESRGKWVIRMKLVPVGKE